MARRSVGIDNLFHELMQHMTVVHVNLELLVQGEPNGKTIEEVYEASGKAVKLISKIRHRLKLDEDT